MAMGLFGGTFDALFDLKSSNREFIALDNEGGDNVRRAEGEDADCDYEKLLQFIFSNGEMHAKHERKIDNIHEDEEEKDPHYELFLSRLKEHKKAYVVESEKNGLPVLIEYEAEGSSKDQQERESPEKMMICAEQLVELSNQKTGLVNNQVVVVHHPSDMQAQSSYHSSTQSARLLMTLAVKKENMRGGRRRKLCKRVGSAQQGQKDKVKNRRKRKKVVKNQSADAREARSGDDNNVENVRKKFKVAEGINLVKEDKEPEILDVMQIEINAHSYQKNSPRSNGVKRNQYEHADQAQDGDKDKVRNQIHIQQLVEGKNVVGEDDKVNDRAIVLIDDELPQEPAQMVQCQNKHIDQARPVMKHEGKIERKIKVKHEGEMGRKIKVKHERKIDRKIKGKSAVKGVHEAIKKTMVLYQDPSPRNCYDVDQVQPSKNDAVHGQRKSMKVVQGDYGLSNKKTDFGNYAVKIGSVEAANCLVTYKNSDENIPEKEGNDEIFPEVEILDSAAYIKQGILTPFVSSTRFDKSMVDDGPQDLGGPSASDEFRKAVLKVLRRPYDKEEYDKHRETIRNGSYLQHYPDLGKSLKKYRYKRRKCLTILRGFFFWLQNLTREGSFAPWKDRQCLAVEPASP